MKNVSLNDVNRFIVLIAFVFCLQACGGSGGSDSSSEQQTEQPETPVTQQETVEPVNYDPDPELLDSSAENSTELYVDENFNFNTFKLISVDVSATSLDGTPLANTLVFVYSLPSDIEELEQVTPEDKDLLFIAKTNTAGLIMVEKEVNQNLDNFLLVLQQIGMENQAIIKLPEQNLIQHQF